MNPYERGVEAASVENASNPFAALFGGDREDRMYAEVCRRRWEAGRAGKEDPYPNGWAG